MIEVALTLPLVLLVLFGIINFGVALYNKAVITNASREGARLGIAYTEDEGQRNAEIISLVNSKCATFLITFGGTKTCTVVPDDTVDSGETLEVKVDFNFTTVAGKLLGIGNTMSIGAVSRMKFEV